MKESHRAPPTVTMSTLSHSAPAPGVVNLLGAVALAGVWFLIAAKTLLLPPLFDESELLHASWLIARGQRLWIDFFEHHSPLYLAINAWLLPTDSAFYVLYAKLVSLLTYGVGGWLFAFAGRLWLDVKPPFRLPFMLFTWTA